jgi:hypothetical protein
MSFYREQNVHSIRKQQICLSCDHTLIVGEPALYCVGIYEGEFGDGYYHQDCRAAETVLNNKLGNGFEWTPLSEFDNDDLKIIADDWPAAFLRVRPQSK